ncbi:MAG TPA: hypothetical protein PLM96_03930 [Methanoregulaceae archaeon]|nr:hypothetical protein [Methanoregulaceae archaeon]MDD3090704.1 hypothetical protein [Methanoregulaceae archaeon]MDD5684822.1 hypothetical protein [Methanoregulaceae archaeon]HPJ73924.1 hypothetical protein [Methanoregulaceae archaeon]HPQ75778.1 hypothetical protein [Methanoregulaceae archaeon]
MLQRSEDGIQSYTLALSFTLTYGGTGSVGCSSARLYCGMSSSGSVAVSAYPPGVAW